MSTCARCRSVPAFGCISLPNCPVCGSGARAHSPDSCTIQAHQWEYTISRRGEHWRPKRRTLPPNRKPSLPPRRGEPPSSITALSMGEQTNTSARCFKKSDSISLSSFRFLRRQYTYQMGITASLCLFESQLTLPSSALSTMPVHPASPARRAWRKKYIRAQGGRFWRQGVISSSTVSRVLLFSPSLARTRATTEPFVSVECSGCDQATTADYDGEHLDDRASSQPHGQQPPI